jgi:hypothetical protein
MRFFLVFAPMLLAAAPSPKDRLSDARELAEAFQFEKSIKVIDATLQYQDLDHETLVSLYELLAVSWATLDKPAKATTAFQLLLTVDPDHQLSKNLTPRTRTPFFEARSLLSRLGPASLEPDPVTRTDGKITELGVTVHDNTLLPARAVRFTVTADGAAPQTQVVKLEKNRHVTLPVSGRTIAWTAELLGDRSAVLRQLSREEAPPVVIAPPPPPPLVDSTPRAAPKEGPWLRPAGVVFAVVGGSALIVGGVFGVQSNSARGQVSNASRDSAGAITGITQARAQELDAEARRDAIIADVLFIAGGAIAATGLAFIIFGGRSESTPVVTLSPAGLTLAGVFE